MQFYKPNASKTGNAIGFQFNSKEGALYAQFVKQTGWNETTKKGSFKDGKKLNIKFNAGEIGAFLNCIERGRAAKLFHQAEKGQTSIQLAAFLKEGARDGITVSVFPKATDGEQGDKFGFWFNSAEERVLKEYLQFVLGHFFSATYSADKKRREQYFQDKQDKPAEKVDDFGSFP